MDLVSHALVGALVASAGLQRKYGVAATATMVAASLIPDADGALMVFGPRAFFQYHRTAWTHSVGGVTLLSAAISAVVYFFTPFKRPALVFGIAFLGLMLHLASDLLTPWPIPILFPFSSRLYSLDLIHFFDPFLLAVFTLSYFAVQRKPTWTTPALVLTIAITAAYLGLRLYGRGAAADIVRSTGPTEEMSVLPQGVSPFRWLVVTKPGSYTTYVVDVMQRRVVETKVIPTMDDQPEAIRSRQSSLVQAFLRRSRFPVVTVTREAATSRVEWRDVHLLQSGGAVRGVIVVIGPDGRILEERFQIVR